MMITISARNGMSCHPSKIQYVSVQKPRVVMLFLLKHRCSNCNGRKCTSHGGQQSSVCIITSGNYFI